MNGAVVPALVAASSGSAMLAGIYAHERGRDARMRASMVRLGVRFPAALDPLHAFAALDSCSGLPWGTEIITEVRASDGRIAHRLWVPAAVRSSVQATLRGVIPSIRLEEAPSTDAGLATLAVRFFFPTPVVLSSDGTVEASRALLSGLNALAVDERVILRWALRADGPRRRPQREPQSQSEKDAERAWRRKTALAGVRVAGLLLVRAGSAGRAWLLAGHVENVLRARTGPVGQLRITYGRGNHRMSALPRVTRTSGWLSTGEVLGVVGWPLGSEVVPGVEAGGRQLAVPRHVPRTGRRLFVGRDGSGVERPVALSVASASRHLIAFGGTGAGKSSLLGRVVLDAIAAGHGGVLLDPKDLAVDLIDRVPARYADRVALLDPSAPGPAVGLDLFGAGDAHLRADVILSVLRKVSEGWGPRIEQHLRMGLQTVAALPRPVLADWLSLYRDPVLRRQAIARLDDPFLVAEWRTFEESLSAAEQFQHTAPAISRINNLLSRPALRRTLNQREATLNIGRLLDEGRWLLVSLNPGVLGESASRLLAAIVVYLAWSGIEARVSLPPARRRPAILALDELASLASLPVGLEVFFERARSMNCEVVAAAQTPGQLPERLRGAILGNAGSLVTFTAAGSDEASRLAKELPGLTAQDVMALGRFEVAARIAVDGPGASSAVVTGRTEPLPPITGQGRVIRERSIRDYGHDPQDVQPPQPQTGPPPGGRIGSTRREP